MSGRGSDNMTQMKQIGIYNISDYIDTCGMKAYFIVPQCPKNYSWAGDRKTDAYVQNIIPLIKHIVKEKDIDPSRIYITGVSAGGRGIWQLLARNKELFAAALEKSTNPYCPISMLWKRRCASDGLTLQRGVFLNS